MRGSLLGVLPACIVHVLYIVSFVTIWPASSEMDEENSSFDRHVAALIQSQQLDFTFRVFIQLCHESLRSMIFLLEAAEVCC
ncbi:hypothetical protein MPTK1_8g03660 [Marchantia polymorpha subsp. ruderalis]|nr:hypothetical protein Mp_8g03660 [Marchantia polymorpha subsp. ruderalis]